MTYLLLITISLLAFITDADGATVRSSVKVAGPYVHLSDIFDGIDEKQDKELFPSPKPGKRYVLHSKRLRRLARRHGVHWTRDAGANQAIIVADSDVFEHDDIIEQLKQEIAAELGTGANQIDVDQRSLDMHFAKGHIGSIRFDKFRFNNSRTRFSTKVYQVEESGDDSKDFRISGRITPLSTIPVLMNNMEKGHIITEEDISWVEIPAHHVHATMITDEANLVGATPRRGAIRAKAPIQKSDITYPKIIHKGEAVVIVAKTPFMTLTTKGKALENGYNNTLIKIMNIDSKRVLQATVLGPKRVSVDVQGLGALS
ncbi:MAG: flagellar basal body P-ring formation chaperone FlgA [Alphaproteobacteria bacterium]